MLNLFHNGASLLAKTFGVGFIDWLGLLQLINMIAGVKMWRDVSYHYEGVMRQSGRNMLQA